MISHEEIIHQPRRIGNNKLVYPTRICYHIPTIMLFNLVHTKTQRNFFWRGPIKVRYVSNEIYENAAVIVNVEHIERRLLDLRRLPHGAVDDDGPMDKA